MKRIDHKFGTGRMIPWRAPSAMMRKGQQGGSGELLTPERQRELDAHCIAELKRLGSDLPYEEFCDWRVPVHAASAAFVTVRNATEVACTTQSAAAAEAARGHARGWRGEPNR